MPQQDVLKTEALHAIIDVIAHLRGTASAEVATEALEKALDAVAAYVIQVHLEAAIAPKLLAAGKAVLAALQWAATHTIGNDVQFRECIAGLEAAIAEAEGTD